VCYERGGDEWQACSLPATSDRNVVLRPVARVLLNAAHGVEHQHGDLGPRLIACERDARHGGPNGRAADVSRSSFVQRLRNHIIVTALTGAKLGVPLHQLPIGLQHKLFEYVLHPAIGNGARSRL